MGTSAPPWVVLETETSEFFVIASPRAAELFFGEFSDDVPSDFRVFDSEGWELEFERDARGTIDQKSARRSLPMTQSVEEALRRFAEGRGLRPEPDRLMLSFIGESGHHGNRSR